MSRVPERPTPLNWDIETVGKPQLPGAVHEANQNEQRVLLGPNGTVIWREPEPTVGLNSGRPTR
jgi:hypothetical protein